MNALEIRGLEVRLGGFKLGPLNLAAPEGAVYGLIGPNGSGKTTTLDLVFGMLRKEAGEIRVMGMEHARLEEIKARAAYVSPETNYQAWGLVGRALDFLRGFYPGWDAEYCARLLSTFGLAPGEKIAGLSFGAKMKLNLVAALAWKPQLLVLDEPTTGLDAMGRRDIFKEVLQAVREERQTVLISSHNLADLERYADHIGFILDGKMLLEGSTAELLEMFRWVDCSLERPLPTVGRPSHMVARRRERDQWRILLGGGEHSLAWLRAQGAAVGSVAPVTLEDLFITLASQEEPCGA